MTFTIQAFASALGSPGAPSWGVAAPGVVFTATGSGGVSSATTDANGWCAIPVAAPGNYTVAVAVALGLTNPSITSQVVAAGGNAARVYLHCKTAIGMYAGLVTAAATDLPKMAAAIGRTPTLINTGLDYTQPKTGWASNAAWSTQGLLKSDTGLTPCISLPMGSKTDGDTAALFPVIASGGLDAVYAAVFAELAKGPPGYLRIGWEMNGNWYPWSVGANDGPAFIAAFQHIVGLARKAIPGWRIVWNPSQVYPPLSAATAAYPGDAWVDVIGVDVYPDSYWGCSEGHCDAPGLATFAKVRGKPFAVCEAGGAPDPTFPSRLITAIQGPQLEYLTIWSCHNYDFLNPLNTDVANAWALALKSI